MVTDGMPAEIAVSGQDEGSVEGFITRFVEGMTMLGRGLTAAAALGLLAWGGTARASDLVPLTGDGGAVTMTLGGVAGETDADTELVHGYHRGFYGYRGFYGGHYRPAFYGGYYRPAFYGGYYRPAFYGGFYGYRPAFYGGFYGYAFPRIYCAPPVYYYYPPVYCAPIGFSVTMGPTSQLLATPPAYNGAPPGPAPGVVPPMQEPNGTFDYNGGPQKPVPLPGANPAPAKAPPRSTVPLEGRLVSVPAPAPPSRFAYPAYGERPAPTSFAVDRTVQATGTTAKKASR
jgi:hypothetical protein